MNEHQLRILNTLKDACADPIITSMANERVNQHLREIGTLASHLVVEMVTLPQARSNTMSEYANLAQRIDGFLMRQKLDPVLARKLAHCAAAGDPAQLDACFAIGRDLMLQLLAIDSSESESWQKQLLQIEASYGQQLVDALTAKDTPSASKKETPAVGLTKSFDEGKLSEFFARSFPAETDLRIVETRFYSGGSSKYTMGIRLEGVKDLPDEVVLRGDSPSSAGFGGASSVDEYRLLKILHAQGVCVAKPLAVEDSGAVFGTPFMVVEKRSGKAIGDMFNLPGQNKALSRDIAQQLARIHLVPTSAFGDWIKGANGSNSDQVLTSLDQSYANWQALQRPSPAFETAFKWLRDNVEITNRSRGLVHGDYSLHNMLVNGDKLSAILDWEYFHIGNPAYDLGYFYYMADNLSSWEEFLQAYQAAGATRPSPEELEYNTLFAVTRLGVMICQAEAAFYAGIAPGLFIALNSGRYTHLRTITRLNEILRRLM